MSADLMPEISVKDQIAQKSKMAKEFLSLGEGGVL